jgi:hypothetical protein
VRVPIELLHSQDRCHERADDGASDVLFEAGQIEPGEADGDREGGPE